MSTTTVSIHAVRRLILFLHISQVVSYSFFRDRIPNGHNVPNPCEGNSVWWGVGHENPNGGGDRNPFGVHFQQQGMQWTLCLCEHDSDGDGRSNGEELGDPNCEFVEGGTPSRITGITHPGVCEPLDDLKCKDQNTFLSCQNKPFSCPAFANASVASVNLTLNRTQVPAVQTTYICQIFDLPDGDYSMIGSTPIIDNVDVMHHIILYGCPDDVVAGVRPDFTYPNAECAMISSICTQIIAIWGVGLAGECLGDKYGFRIGSQGVKTAILELHWNNPLIKRDYTDSSGLKLYYTPNKRPNDAATMFIGPPFLLIPPQQNGLEQHGGCPAECTKHMLQNAPVYIPSILPHMHYLGRGMKVSIRKNGSDTFDTVLDVQNYNYETPNVYAFDEPLELSPGDEVNVSCTFFSVDRSNYTFWGLQTSDEMCYAIVTYYPYQPAAGTFCSGQGSVGYCGDLVINDNAVAECFEESRFWNDTTAFIAAQVYQNCDVISGLNCTPACKALVDNLTATYPECLSDGVKSEILSTVIIYNNDEYTKHFIQGLLSCDTKPGLGDLNSGKSDGDTLCNTSPSAVVLSTFSTHFYGLLLVITMAMMLINS